MRTLCAVAGHTAIVILAACGRIAFDARVDATGTGDATGDAFDDSACTWSQPVRLQDLNTNRSESEPALAPDGTTIVFASDRMGGGTSRLFVSTRAGNGWTPPALISALDHANGAAGPMWNAAGDRLYFASYRMGPLHLYISTYNGSFGPPQLVSGLQALTEELAPTVRGDELEMFFSGRVPPSQISYATRATTADPWQPRGNVPELVGIMDHGYPGVSGDGRTIYFEATAGSRFGIVRSRRPTLDASFGPPEPVPALDGSPAGDGDPQPSFDGSEIFFASDRASPGDFDLYRADRICP
jgi:Tol biopolymer transport system component